MCNSCEGIQSYGPQSTVALSEAFWSKETFGASHCLYYNSTKMCLLLHTTDLQTLLLDLAFSKLEVVYGFGYTGPGGAH